MKHRTLFAPLLPLLAAVTVCCAADTNAPAPSADAKKPDAPREDKTTNAAPEKKEGSKDAASDKKEPKDELSETTNSVTINGVVVKYKATAGTLVIKDEEGKPHVSFFFVAYARLDDTNASGVRSVSPSTAARVPLRSGCTWGCSVPAAFFSRTTAACRRLRFI